MFNFSYAFVLSSSKRKNMGSDQTHVQIGMEHEAMGALLNMKDIIHVYNLSYLII